MKKLLILLFTMLFALPGAQAETVSPFEVMTLDAAAETAAADHPLILRGWISAKGRPSCASKPSRTAN